MGSENPSDVFRFLVEERTQCCQSRKVRYTERVDYIMQLPVAMEAATNKGKEKLVYWLTWCLSQPWGNEVLTWSLYMVRMVQGHIANQTSELIRGTLLGLGFFKADFKHIPDGSFTGPAFHLVHNSMNSTNILKRPFWLENLSFRELHILGSSVSVMILFQVAAQEVY